MADASLQLAANGGTISDQIARLDEKVEEIEPAGLEDLVSCNRPLQSVMQKGGEIGVARRNEGIEISLGLVSKREDFIARSVSKGRFFSALPSPTPPASDSTKIRFESVVVAIADCLQPDRFVDEARNFRQIPCEIVVRPPTALNAPTQELAVWASVATPTALRGCEAHNPFFLQCKGKGVNDEENPGQRAQQESAICRCRGLSASACGGAGRGCRAAITRI